MASTIDLINLLAWMAVLFSTSFRLLMALTAQVDVIKEPIPRVHTIDISMEVLILQVVQGFQVMDIVLILLKKSKGSLLGSIAQITGRLVVAFGFLSA